MTISERFFQWLKRRRLLIVIGFMLAAVIGIQQAIYVNWGPELSHLLGELYEAGNLTVVVLFGMFCGVRLKTKNISLFLSTILAVMFLAGVLMLLNTKPRAGTFPPNLSAEPEPAFFYGFPADMFSVPKNPEYLKQRSIALIGSR